PDSKPNDILYWNTTLVTPDVDGLVLKLRGEHVRLISSKVVVTPKRESTFSKGVVIADPDGHGAMGQTSGKSSRRRRGKKYSNGQRLLGEAGRGYS
ncbi:MAG TPA: hypothetical protein VGH55_01725, partial [Chthoniobacterales bacterium]